MAQKGQSKDTKASTAKKKANKAENAIASAEASPSPATTESTEPVVCAVRPSFPIVGIGASAGGLEALELFFKAMPDDTGTGCIVVVHLDPTHVSLLPELLQKHTKMPVCQIMDGMVVKRNHVYVIPPNKDLTILHGRLHLMDIVQPRGSNLRIDSFLRSLAEDQERNAVCIILSGTGSDGALGVKAIKSKIGMAMVQDEVSAKYESMPRNATDTGLVDYVLPPTKMPEQLIKYTKHMSQSPGSVIIPLEGPMHESLQKIFIILRTRTGHDFSLYKRNTLCRRIERRMNVHQIDDISDYIRFLQESDREADILFKELLIGVTNFFRDPKAFEILKDKMLPTLLEGKQEDYGLRVWIPGCATGEEAYSIAILLHECMEEIGKHFHVQIFGTDIDEKAIDVARGGVYQEGIAADVGPERITRYFTQEEDGRYRVKKIIRETLIFAPQNLIRDPPFTRLDLLCCRNLLIYLGAELQHRLLPVFHYTLKPDGLLFLGSSETIGRATDLFLPANKKWKIFRKKQTRHPAHPVLDFPPQPTYEARDMEASETIQRAEELSALQLVETILQQTDIPPCAIINDACNVVYIHGRTGRYLEPAEGRASVNIVEMARPGLRADLASAIRQVATHKQEVICTGLQVEHNGSQSFVKLTVKPLLEQSAIRGLMMVMFEEADSSAAVSSRTMHPVEIKQVTKSIDELDQELRHTGETLQSTIEELETSNEELKSTNEELQSTNEELQSTNEELETSKEELQSLNEESATVNSELQARMDDLAKVNDDMKNLLDSTGIATIFLDTDLRIRRFTPRSTEIIPLTGTDCGRPIKHLASALIDVDLEQCGMEVLETLIIQDRDVESENGKHYVLRIRPYRTLSNVIDGVVITFEDITIRKRAEKVITESEVIYRTLFEMASDSIVLIDASDGTIVESNQRAYERLGYGKEEFEKLTLSVIDAVESPQEVKKHIEKILAEGSDLFETKHKAKDGELVAVRVRTKSLFINDRRLLLSTWQDVERADDADALSQGAKEAND